MEFLETAANLCSPRMWGWTDAEDQYSLVVLVFPTHVGMNRTYLCLPRL